MTPHEMLDAVRRTAAAQGELWQRLNMLRKVFKNDDALCSRATWEAFGANAFDLTEAPGWWDLLADGGAAQPFDRVRAALDALPALERRAASELNTVRGLARAFWSVDNFVSALVRLRAPEVSAAIPSLPPEAQAVCAAHLLLGDLWNETDLPPSLLARAAEGYATVVHDEPLHAKVRAHVGDEAWWTAVANAMARPDVKIVGLQRLAPAVDRCDLPTLLAALEGVVRSYEDHLRLGAVMLVDAAFARDAVEAQRRLDAKVVEALKAVEVERRGDLAWDDARKHRARRLPSALVVPLARRAGAKGEVPPLGWDEPAWRW